MNIKLLLLLSIFFHLNIYSQQGNEISDIDMVQLITVFRLIFPDLGITLSTREPSKFRDNIVSLGITTLSAESSTNPGGYSSCDSEEQFATSDKRDLSKILIMLKQKGLDPVFKDWDYSLM